MYAICTPCRNSLLKLAKLSEILFSCYFPGINPLIAALLMVAKIVEHVSPVQLQHKLLDLSIRTVEPCQMLNLCTPYSEHSWLEEESQVAKCGAYASMLV